MDLSFCQVTYTMCFLILIEVIVVMIMVKGSHNDPLWYLRSMDATCIGEDDVRIQEQRILDSSVHSSRE